MPTYEYHCDACGQNFDAFHSMTADPLKKCMKCEHEGSVRRLISGGAGLIFKGSGFYITDYRSSSYKEAAKKDKEGSTSNSSKEGSTSSASSETSSPAPSTPTTPSTPST